MSLCYLGGYYIETKCHVGHVCEYDAIGELGLRESIFSHKIKYMIDNIIPKWNNTLHVGNVLNEECTDCKDWKVIV